MLSPLTVEVSNLSAMTTEVENYPWNSTGIDCAKTSSKGKIIVINFKRNRLRFLYGSVCV